MSTVAPHSHQMHGIPVPAMDRDYVEEDELLVTIVHRHPVGIILIYLEAFVAILAIGFLMTMVFPSLLNGFNSQSGGLLTALALLGVGIVALVLFVATYIYRQNRILVTDRSLVQVLQKGLFIRKVSRLSMSNVEDVTAEHRGILSTIFNYGVLNIQTAGERENFLFSWCPEPDTYADRILEARQAYAERLEDEA